MAIRLLPRFTLKTAAITLTLSLLVLGFCTAWRQRAMRQAHAIAAIQNAGGWVQIEEDQRLPWLRAKLGHEYFDAVTFASLPREYHLVRHLPQLESLELTGEFAAEDVAHLAANRSLVDISFRTTEVSVEVLRRLSQLSQLRSVDLAGREVGPEHLHAMSGLRQLRKLNLASAEIDADALRQLAGMAHLEWLNLANCQVDCEQFRDLESARDFPHLVSVDVSGADPADAIVESPLLQQQLVELNIQGCGLSDNAIEALASFHSLRSLDVSGIKSELNQTPELLDVLARTRSLRYVVLDVALDQPDFANKLHSMRHIEQFEFDSFTASIAFVDGVFNALPEATLQIDGVDFDRAEWLTPADRRATGIKKSIERAASTPYSSFSWQRYRLKLPKINHAQFRSLERSR